MDPMYSQKLVFEGISVDVTGDGTQHHLDATVGEFSAAMSGCLLAKLNVWTSSLSLQTGDV